MAVPERVIDKAVAEKVIHIACSPEDMGDLRDLVEVERTKGTANAANDETSLHVLIGKCNERLERLTDALLDGVITKEALNKLKLIC